MASMGVEVEDVTEREAKVVAAAAAARRAEAAARERAKDAAARGAAAAGGGTGDAGSAVEGAPAPTGGDAAVGGAGGSSAAPSSAGDARLPGPAAMERMAQAYPEPGTVERAVMDALLKQAGALTGAVEMAEAIGATLVLAKDARRNAEAALAAKARGNRLFASREYIDAAELYTQALELSPLEDGFAKQRAVFFSNRAACFMHLGRFEEARDDASDAIALAPDYTKAWYRRATAHEKLESLDDALKDVEKVLELEPRTDGARADAERLRRAIDERNEKMKDEMLGKLKDMGNTILGKFGMSLDNFKMEKDPNTGSYSISMQK